VQACALQNSECSVNVLQDISCVQRLSLKVL
jgi:hypothetical protein